MDAKPIKVGFLYAATRNDYGWNQAFAVAAKRIAQLPGVKLIEQERVPETAQAERVMESMIQLDGCKVIVATSFGYWPFIQKLASKYPDVLFVHGGGLWKEGDPKNTIGYRGYMEEPHYLCGIAAGMMSKTGKLGFIGSKPLFFIFNNCNGFVLGARSVKPGTTCQVVITGDWDNPVKEAEDGERACPIRAWMSLSQTSTAPRLRSRQPSDVASMSCGYHTDLVGACAEWFSHRR